MMVMEDLHIMHTTHSLSRVRVSRSIGTVKGEILSPFRSPRRPAPVLTRHSSLLACLLSLALLAGCAPLVPSSAPERQAAGSLGDAVCQGDIMPLLPGFEKVENPTLLTEALGQPGEGKLCRGEVWRAIAVEVSVYRLQDEGGEKSFGRWWTFAPPEGTKAAYRENYDICETWGNPLTQAAVCRLPKGAVVVVGPGQSAKCDVKKTLPASSTNQVFIPQETLGKLKDCKIGRLNWF
jgi:hypothetical protein